MGSRSLLRENDFNGFAEGLALNDTSPLPDLGQRPFGYPFLPFPLKKVFEGFTGARHNRDGWSLALLVVVAIEWEC